MKNVMMNFKEYSVYFGIFFMTLGFTSCSSDDDADDILEEATGSITVEDNQTISQNTIAIQSVTVDQDSWIVAVMGGDENTNNFISDPVMVEEPSASNVELTINDDVDLMGGEAGNEISIKLYANNPNGGNMSEWDESDEAITLATETITVFVEDSGMMSFSDLDTNADGMLFHKISQFTLF